MWRSRKLLGTCPWPDCIEWTSVLGVWCASAVGSARLHGGKENPVSGLPCWPTSPIRNSSGAGNLKPGFFPKLKFILNQLLLGLFCRASIQMGLLPCLCFGDEPGSHACNRERDNQHGPVRLSHGCRNQRFTEVFQLDARDQVPARVRCRSPRGVHEYGIESDT